MSSPSGILFTPNLTEKVQFPNILTGTASRCFMNRFMARLKLGFAGYRAKFNIKQDGTKK